MNIRLLSPTHRVSVSWEIEQDREPAWIRAAKKGARAGLYTCDVSVPCSVELLFVTPEEIQNLNREQRQIDRVTDVLSFPSLDVSKGEQPALYADRTDYTDGYLFLGSIVICAQQALKQAQEYGHRPEREFAFLAAHSILHLLGYDHERSPEEEKEMFALQELILNRAGLPR